VNAGVEVVDLNDAVAADEVADGPARHCGGAAGLGGVFRERRGERVACRRLLDGVVLLILLAGASWRRRSVGRSR
jgi:hypothetical protein